MFGPLRWLTLLALLLCGGAGHSASSEERRKEVWVRECVNYTAGFKVWRGCCGRDSGMCEKMLKQRVVQLHGCA